MATQSEEILQQEVTQLEQYVRGVQLAAGVQKVTLPGDPERAVLATRTAQGIPLDDGNWQALVTLAEGLKVPLPA